MDAEPDTVRFPREAVENIELPPPPAETSARTFIGPAPAPRQPRRSAIGTKTPLPQAVVVDSEQFETSAPEPVVIIPVVSETMAVAPVADERIVVEPVADESITTVPAAVEPAAVESLGVDSFGIEPAAADAGAFDAFAPDATILDPVALQPAVAEEPRVVFYPEAQRADLMQTQPELPEPAPLAPEWLVPAATEPVERDPEMLQPGTLVDDYEIAGFVASDAVGSVYAAHDPVGRSIAIKVIARSVFRDEPSAERLLAGARSAVQLDSLHLVEIHSAGRLHDGRVYLVIEPAPGETLTRRLMRGRIAIDEAMEILSQVASAVADVHKAGIVRCDLGPDNVILHKTEEGLEVKLLQFGLARLSKGNSPERSRGEVVGPPSDVHALGLLTQHILVGTPVDQSVVMSDARPDVPAAVDQLVDSMLTDDPRRRPTAVEVQAAARRLAHSLYRGTSVELPFRLQARLWLQKPWNRVLLGVQIALAVAGLASYLFLRDSGDSDKDSKAAATAPASENAETATAAPTPAPAKAESSKPNRPAPPKAESLPRARKPSPSEARKTSSSEARKTSSSEARKSSSKPAAKPAHEAAPPKPAAPKLEIAKPEPPKPEPPKPEPPKTDAPKRDRDAPITDPFGEM